MAAHNPRKAIRAKPRKDRAGVRTDRKPRPKTRAASRGRS